jgi:NAD(P)-dependent dehydrogenase (short-subunit alcohol dehydrogenase family)
MNKTVLITGSSRGLGFEIAKILSEEEFTVILNGREEKTLQAAINALKNSDNHLYFCFDLLKDNVVTTLKKFLIEKELSIDIVIHNLGGKFEYDTHPIKVDILNKTMKFNLYTAIEINNFIIPEMIKKGGGKIIHIGSKAGIDANASPCYSISKGALHIYIKNIARFYAKSNIMICGVIPGILDHKGSEWDKKRTNEPEKYESCKKQMPLGRFAHPKEIAPFVVNLCKLDTMQITGSLFILDGGL